MSQQLWNVLQGCLDSNTIHASQLRLKQLSEDSLFTQALLGLVPNQNHNMLIMVLTTLKNYLLARYNSPDRPITQDQKNILKGSILDLFYEIMNNQQAINIYKEIIYIIIAVDYPWQGIQDSLLKDLNGSIMASIYFFRQVAKVNQWFQNEERQKFQEFISKFFPHIQVIIQQILSNYSEVTAKLLDQILKTFYSAFHIETPYYLRDFANIDRWLVYFQTIINAQSGALAPSSQAYVAKIYLKLFALYCNQIQDNKQFKGWAQAFRQKYAQRLFQTIFALIIAKKDNQQILSTLINCLHEIVKHDYLNGLITEQHCQTLLYNNCLLPLCQTLPEQMNLFSKDQIQYVRRQQDLSCFSARRSVLDFIQICASKLVYNGKSEMIRMVQYSASVLKNPNSTEAEQQVIVRLLSKIGKQILKNKYLKAEFQNLTLQYFLPLLKSNSFLLNSLTCQLLSLYLPFGQLSNQTVTLIMQVIYDKIINTTSLVVRYNAILAFTALLNHKTAFEAAKPHFSKILQIYVEIMNTFDHQNLISCLQSIVKYFSNQIIDFAPQLLTHLLTMFASFCQNNREEVDEEQDQNTPATAALSTVKQILSCELNPEIYFNISTDIIEMLRGIFNRYDNFFDEILSLFNVLVYEAKTISNYQYPYLACRKLLEGDNSILERCGLQSQIVGELLKAEQADSQFQQSLVSILKNLIQKMPNQILHRYPYPKHQQLLLCLIQNNKLSPQDFSNLNTQDVDAIWSPYLTTYSWLIYGVGNIVHPQNVKAIVGVSVFPWIKSGVTIQIVKLIVNAIEDDDQDDDDDLLQQNTAQMLQKYANQQQEDQEQNFYESSGVNYSYLYDSPYDSAKDRQMLIQYLKSMSQQDALNLINSLPLRYRKKVETLFK